MTFLSNFLKSFSAAAGREASPGARMTSAVSAAVIVVAGAAFIPAAAQADYEQVPGHFGEAEEAAPANLTFALGAAINERGEGGVPAGSLYVVGRNARVKRFTPGEEGEEPRFREAWGWGVGDGAEEFQRCGPAYKELEEEGEPLPPNAYPACKHNNKPNAPFGGEETGHFESPAAVAVDQATGNVYVRNSSFAGTQRKHHLIEVFTATGEPVGEGFGDAGSESPSPESIEEGPEKLHYMVPASGAIAVDEAGTVYLSDRDYSGVEPKQSRIMSFEPCSPPEYDNYCYTGQENDIVTGDLEALSRIALIGSDRLAVSVGQEAVREYPLEGGEPAPICSLPVSGQLFAMAANPASGEIFYFRFSDRSIHRLGPCDPETGEFEELQAKVKPSPTTKGIYALAVNPALAWSEARPPGVLYAIDGEHGLGDVLAPAEIFPPRVLSTSAANATTSSATLKARIDPRGAGTSYRFQYLTRAAYEANQPDERQALTVKATGGLFGLAFKGKSLGGEFSADLSAGSTEASSLATAAGSADLKAGVGTADLHGAVGKGAVVAESSTVTLASTSEGAFAVGQTISGAGIPAGAKIAAVSGTELTLSAKATESAAGVSLHAGIANLTGLSTGEGEFEAGQTITGEGIPANTTILSATATALTLSNPVTKPGTAVAIAAGQTTLDNLAVSEGSFAAGQPISGAGIPAGTEIVAVHATSLEISKAPTAPGEGVELSSAGPYPLAVGESVAGPGIAAGTKIAAIEAGKLTLSQPAEATQEGAGLRAGLAFDATAGEVQAALAGLATIGAGNVAVSGGPGDEAGSSPYAVTFGGALANSDLPELETDSSGLSGGAAEATVATAHQGGGGFAGAAETSSATIPSGEAAAAVAGVSGLSPDTAYAFRALASSPCDPEHPSEPCEAHGAPVFFSTYPTAPAGLPDSRAYELVSPAQKHGGEAFPADPAQSSCAPETECKPPGNTNRVIFPMQSAPGGQAVTYMGYAFSPTAGAAVFNSYLSRRTAAGWQTTAMSPALLATKSGQHLAYSPSLGADVIHQQNPPLSPLAPAGYANIYMQGAADPATRTPLLTAPPPNRGEGGLKLDYAGASADFSCQFFAANDALVGASPYAPAPPDPTSTGRDLYEWCGGALKLVNVLPGNEAVGGEAAFASASPEAHGVSEDGRRVFFEAGGSLYVREDGQITREVTHPGAFLAASADGLKALLDDGGDACLYSIATEACADLTAGEGGFEGIAGHDADLSHVYFLDSAALPGSGENERGEEAQAAAHNLYLYRPGAPTEFIATLAAADNNASSGLQDWAAVAGKRTAQASPSGRYLAFGSTAPLTGYGNVGPCGVVIEEGKSVIVDSPCAEVFLYDSATGHLACASCNPTGEAPRGPSTLRRISGAADWLPQPRYLTDAGRLYFDSQDRLSPRDTNGKVEDVYEAEPYGVGSCARAGGCVSLISPGTGGVDSNFLAMSEDGSDVFFTSRERLVNRDTDELFDLYDAREGGGFASESETQRAECQGEACQPSPEAPAVRTPSSAAFEGKGNVSEKSGGKSCQAPARKAQKLSGRAKKLRRNAKRVAKKDAKKARRMRSKAAGLAKQARRQSNRAGRCRRGRSSSVGRRRAKHHAKRQSRRYAHHDRRTHR